MSFIGKKQIFNANFNNLNETINIHSILKYEKIMLFSIWLKSKAYSDFGGNQRKTQPKAEVVSQGSQPDLNTISRCRDFEYLRR